MDEVISLLLLLAAFVLLGFVFRDARRNRGAGTGFNFGRRGGGFNPRLFAMSLAALVLVTLSGAFAQR